MKRNNTVMVNLRVDSRDAATILRFLSEKKMYRPSSLADLMRKSIEGFSDVVRENFSDLHVESETEAIDMLSAYGLLKGKNIIKGNLTKGLKMSENSVLSPVDSSTPAGNDLSDLLAKAEARAKREAEEKNAMKKMRGE